MPIPSDQLASGHEIPDLRAFTVVKRRELQSLVLLVGASNTADAIEVYQLKRGADGLWTVTLIVSHTADVSITKHLDALLGSDLVLMIYYEDSSGTAQTILDLRGFGTLEA